MAVRSTLVLLAATALLPAQGYRVHAFDKRQLSTEFHCEGATFGDFNGDRKIDLASGPYWYEGPDFERRHEIYAPHPFDPKTYSDNFFAFVHDFDADGWNDLLIVGFPGKDASWFRNPRGEDRHWERHVVFDVVDNESPAFEDLDGDGRPELVCQNDDRLGYASPDWSDPAEKWTFHPISKTGIGGRFTHGLGVGDVDGDGRKDVLWVHGWYQQPASLAGLPEWRQHLVNFASRGGAQMFAYDIDGDGDNDVVSSTNAHGFGLYWFEQRRTAEQITFERHTIMGEKPGDNPYGVLFGNLHAQALIDVDGDGLRDIVTGNRYFAHNGNDPADLQPAPLFWFELVRTGGSGGAHFVPHEIDSHSGVGTQVVAGDVNGDDLPDVVVGNKMGTFVHLHRVETMSEREWQKRGRDEIRSAAKPEADAEQHHGYAPAEAAARMTVPEGFRVELVAGEPDLQQPVALTIDERGRLWIAEAFSYPKRRPDGEGLDKIVVFEDSTGGGKLDKRTVFAEGLNLVSGLEVGFGGVWVGAAPYLLFIPDRNGDLVADGEPQILLDGWGYEDTHETLNAFTWGPDGWLYGCHGIFTHSNVGAPGTPDAERTRLNAGVWRFHPIDRRFEVFAHGTSNPWGVDFDEHGQAFVTACVIPHLFHMIQGGKYDRQSGGHFDAWVFEDIKTIADHLHYLGSQPHTGNRVSDDAGGGHAHCGAMIYLGDAFPDSYRNSVFVNNIHGNCVNNDRLVRSGTGFVGTHAPDFLRANDAWFRGINLRYGPDGNVYLIDWYDEQACHRSRVDVWDRTNGRVYKVSYGAPRNGRVDLGKATDADLVGMQTHQNEWFARVARRVLQERGPKPEVHQTLTALLHEAKDAVHRLRALWTLHACGGLQAALALELLGDADEYVRAWTIQLALERWPVPTEVRARLASMARDDASPVVRLYLASALQRLPVAERWDLATALLAHAEDADDHNQPLMLWYGVEPLVMADTERALTMAANSRIDKVARFIYRRAASGDAPRFAELIGALDATATAARQSMILEETLRPLHGGGTVQPPRGWAPAFATLRHAGGELEERAVTLAVLFGDREVLPELRAVLADDRAPTARRRWALDALMEIEDPAIVPTLQALVDQPELCASALQALAAFDDARTPALVLARYDVLSRSQQDVAVRTLTSRETFTTPLLEAVVEGRLPRSILDSASIRRRVARFGSAKVDKLVETAWGKSVAPSGDKEAEIGRYKQMLPRSVRNNADRRQGRVLFAKTCMTCHKLFGQGNSLGPDLTGSNRGDLDYILFNMIDPSAEVAAEYRTTTVRTLDGEFVAGLVVERNDRSITLRNDAGTQTVALADVARDDDGQPWIKQSELSLMPEGQLRALSERQVRDLIGYLASDEQVPMAATADSAGMFFNGVDLTCWDADPEIWSVEDGELVGRSATGLAKNDFAVSHIALGDFRLTFEVKLVGNAGNSGVQFRSEVTDTGMQGYQADIGKDWWGKLYEEEKRGVLWSEPGDGHVRAGEWNTYEIVAVGHRVRTAINGHKCVDLEDADGRLEGFIGLQVHSGGPTEVRFRKFVLELDPQPELQTVK